jgi:hypothetical protein
VLSVGDHAAQIEDLDMASGELGAALPSAVLWTHPIAEIIPFDDQSPDDAFDQPVGAELTAVMASGRSSVTVRTLTEQAVLHFAIYGQAARNRLVRKVTGAVQRAVQAEPERLRYESATGTTEARVVIIRSAEQFDRRGRTQSYQAFLGARARRGRRPAPVHPDQADLFAELDEAERVTTEEMGENVSMDRDELDDDQDNDSDGTGAETP